MLLTSKDGNLPREPKDTDLFMVDIRYGHHYHIPGCLATTKPTGIVPVGGGYRELSYGEIRAIRTHDGSLFEPDICVKIWQNAPRYWNKNARMLNWATTVSPESLVDAGLSQKEASELVKQFQRNFPQVAEWAAKVKARKNRAMTKPEELNG